MSSIHTRRWRKLRQDVFKEYGEACAYCGYQDSVMTIDHIIPRSRGGLDILENLLPACRKCNYSKSNKIGGFFEGAGTPPTLHELNPPKNVSVSHD